MYLKCINIECLTFKMIFSGIVNCLIIAKRKFNENIALDLEQIPKFSRFLLESSKLDEIFLFAIEISISCIYK